MIGFAEKIVSELQSDSNDDVAIHHIRFFKCFDGGYGDVNDKFYGVSSKVLRNVVKKYYKDITLEECETLLQNSIHEVRAVALLALTLKYDKTRDDLAKQEIVKLYLNNTKQINNWDLVDISAYKIVGRFCFENSDYLPIYRLSESENLWEQRMSVVANWFLVRQNVFTPLLDISEKFLTHKHELIHKAVGWILREMGKTGESGFVELINFLEKHSRIMPRTMLRYAIEKLPREQKQLFMAK